MITGSTIPDDVRRFVLTSIPSVPYLEAMLLLRNDAAQAWDCAMLARRLYLADKTAAELLAELHAAGVLRAEQHAPERYRFHPADEHMRLLIDRVADAYSTRLVEITNLIHSKSGKKAQQFADAFKWRKES